MNPEEATRLIKLGLIDGDFSGLLRIRKRSDFDNFIYALNQLAIGGVLHFGIATKDWKDVSPVRSDEYRFWVWVTAPGAKADGKPNFQFNSITDLRGFIVGLLASQYIDRRDWLKNNGCLGAR